VLPESGFIQDIERFFCRGAVKLAGNLKTLGFSAGKSISRLA